MTDQLRDRQQTLAINPDGSVGIAVQQAPAAAAEAVIPMESVLRGQELVFKRQMADKAKIAQDKVRGKASTISVTQQTDQGARCKLNPLLPIPQVGLSQDPEGFTTKYLLDTGIEFDRVVEFQLKSGVVVNKMMVIFMHFYYFH
jgi:hypothetical protein